MKTKFNDLVPKGFKASTRENLAFTDYAQQSVLELVAAGEYAYVACEIAGVNRQTMSQWLAKGRQSDDEKDPYFRFFQKYKHSRLKGLAQLRENRREAREGYATDTKLMSNQAVPLPMLLFTQQNCETILANLRQGMFPNVAAEAAGVPANILARWVERGRREGPGSEYYPFAMDYMVASAQARGVAEARVYEDAPIAWLLHGPGRNRPDSPGWSKTNEVTGPGGGPVQIVTTWATAQSPTVIEGEVSRVIAEAAAPPTDE